MKPERRKLFPIILAAAAVLMIAAAAYGTVRFLQVRDAGRQADRVLEIMYELVPGLGDHSEGSTGAGRDPLASMQIDGISIVGCLEIPELDLMIPVTAAGERHDGLASLEGGSPLKGDLVIEGDRKTSLRNLSGADPEDAVYFTDIDGVRYSFRVTTQYHIKDWAEADQDLMVCYRTDDQTRFVLGCTRSDD